jgi:hypothetical protein
MTDLLAILDDAIEALEPAVSSRSSRLQTQQKWSTGTVNALKLNVVPVVPVVPVRKQENRVDDEQLTENLRTHKHTKVRGARANIPSKRREQREQRELERIHPPYHEVSSSRSGLNCAPANGNNGNYLRNFISSEQSGPATHDRSGLQDLFDERVTIAEFEGGIPHAWAEGFARLQMTAYPAAMRPDRWRQMIDDAGRFLDRWAAKAAALGWDTASVFGVHADRPIERVDCAGLVWLLRGNDIEAISPSVARIRTRSGAVQIYDRRPQSPSVPLWELRGELRPADRTFWTESQ